MEPSKACGWVSGVFHVVILGGAVAMIRFLLRKVKKAAPIVVVAVLHLLTKSKSWRGNIQSKAKWLRFAYCFIAKWLREASQNYKPGAL